MPQVLGHFGVEVAQNVIGNRPQSLRYWDSLRGGDATEPRGTRPRSPSLWPYTQILISLRGITTVDE